MDIFLKFILLIRTINWGERKESKKETKPTTFRINSSFGSFKISDI
jgi:hypothetical protein